MAAHDHHGDVSADDDSVKLAKQECCNDFCVSLAIIATSDTLAGPVVSSIHGFIDDRRFFGEVPPCTAPRISEQDTPVLADLNVRWWVLLPVAPPPWGLGQVHRDRGHRSCLDYRLRNRGLADRIPQVVFPIASGDAVVWNVNRATNEDLARTFAFHTDVVASLVDVPDRASTIEFDQTDGHIEIEVPDGRYLQRGHGQVDGNVALEMRDVKWRPFC
ncbi:hypothetical protein GGD55_003912 [Rhizobium giardinii]|uniref:Uncharacterized protein n=1 Tax=Rhizobium giardinii TaxID=56731 RepID=A0A7W8XA10_9HYPH|nr:hypothetical protein [Rhizobium giardinii]